MWSTPCWTTSRSRPGRRQHLIRDLRIDRSMARSMPSRARLRSSTYVARSGAQVFFTLQAATTTITCIVLHSRSRTGIAVGSSSRDAGIEISRKNAFFLFLLFFFFFFFFVFLTRCKGIIENYTIKVLSTQRMLQFRLQRGSVLSIYPLPICTLSLAKILEDDSYYL